MTNVESKASAFGLKDVLVPMISFFGVFLALFVKDIVAPVKQETAFASVTLQRMEADIQDIRAHYLTRDVADARFDEVNRRLSRLEEQRRASLVP